MTEQLILSIGAAVAFIALSVAYLGLRELFERQVRPSRPRPAPANRHPITRAQIAHDRAA